MRILLVLALGCSGPQGTKPPPVQRTTSDNTCENVAWSCVTMKLEEPSRCVEGDASQTSQYQASCAADGRFALGACMRDNLVGGCTLARGDRCATTWYYPPATRESVEADCAKHEALYVAP
jgi:hypothetical protein